MEKGIALVVAVVCLSLPVLCCASDLDVSLGEGDEAPLLGEGLASTAAASEHRSLLQKVKDVKLALRRHTLVLHKTRAWVREAMARNAAKSKAGRALEQLVRDETELAQVTQMHSRDLGEGAGAVPMVMRSESPPAPVSDPIKSAAKEAKREDKLIVSGDHEAGVMYHKLAGSPLYAEGHADGSLTYRDHDVDTTYTHPSKANAGYETAVGKALRDLKKRHPEAGIWAGYRTPDKKVEALTKAGVAEEERREKLTPMERAEEDADRAVSEPTEEVRKAFIMPPPLVYKPPLESNEVIEERARESKAKAKIRTFRAQQAAQERAQKMVVASESGINPLAKNKKKVNTAGIFCTASRQKGCVRVEPLDEKLQCNTKLLVCQFESPSQPGKFIVTEPRIPCPTGKQQCIAGAAKVEASNWQHAQALKMRKLWLRASQEAQADEGKRERLEKVHRREARLKVKRKIAMLEARFISVQLKANRPSKGVYRPIAVLEPHDRLVKLREQAMQTRQKVGKVHSVLKKLGILSLGCQEAHGRCGKQCATAAKTVRNDPDGSKCRTACDTTLKTCMVGKIKRAQFAAKLAASNAVAKGASGVAVDLGESALDAAPEKTRDPASDRVLAANPELRKMAKACKDGLPGSCAKLKKDLTKAKKQAKAKSAPSTTKRGANNVKARRLPPAKPVSVASIIKHTVMKQEKKEEAKEKARDARRKKVKAAMMKKAKQLAARMGAKSDSKAAENKHKKEQQHKVLVARQNRCTKPKLAECSAEAQRYQRKAKQHMKSISRIVRRAKRMQAKCAKKALRVCKKRSLLFLTRRYEKSAANVRQAANRKGTKWKGKPATSSGCTDRWKNCAHLAAKCSTHPVLRCNCRSTCGACQEKFKRGVNCAHARLGL
jgi:hypothetical protein